MPQDAPQPDPKPTPPAPSVTPIQAHCLRCDHNLSNLPEFARYCPHCGFDMLGTPPGTVFARMAGQNPRMSGLRGGWEHLLHICNLPASAQSPTPHVSSTPSPVVQGYSNALYRLGRRYEFGRGAIANPREALRCYAKSARLGNFWAMARLASQVFVNRHGADPATAETPPSPLDPEAPAPSPPSDVLPSPDAPAH